MRFALVSLLLLPALAGVDASDWKLLRGDWSSDDGSLACDFDPALYEKYKDHGPILVREFEQPTADATLRATFTITQSEQSEKPPRVILTFDGTKGHVMRVFLFVGSGSDGQMGPTSRAIVWEEGSKKSTPIVPNGKMPRIMTGQQHRIAMSTEGETATIVLDGQTFTATHPAIGRPKTNAKLGFAFGDLTLPEIVAEP